MKCKFVLIVATAFIGAFSFASDAKAGDHLNLGVAYEQSFDESRTGLNLIATKMESSGKRPNIARGPGAQVYIPLKRAGEPFYLRISGHFEFRAGLYNWQERDAIRFLGLNLRPEIHIFAGQGPRASRGIASFAGGVSASIFPVCFRWVCPEFTASAYYGIFGVSNTAYSVGLRLVYLDD